MGYHRRLFVFIDHGWQEKREYATRKNEHALHHLSADRVRQRSHPAASIPGTGSTATASDCLPIRQLMGVYLRTGGNELSGHANRGYREPV